MSTSDRLRLFTEILTCVAYDQDPPSGYFEESLKDALVDHNMSKDDLDALAKELGFGWRCQTPPPDPGTLCRACGGGFVAHPTHGLCSCGEGAKVDRGAALRYKSSIGQCCQTGCEARADVDGWCDEHSEQFKRYGTHHLVGGHGMQGAQGASS
jgi:hypothetical protein